MKGTLKIGVLMHAYFSYVTINNISLCSTDFSVSILCFGDLTCMLLRPSVIFVLPGQYSKTCCNNVTATGLHLQQCQNCE
jgi:hypothetical protein